MLLGTRQKLLQSELYREIDLFRKLVIGEHRNGKLEGCHVLVQLEHRVMKSVVGKTMYSRHAIVKFVSKNKNSKVTRGKGKSRYLVLHRFCLVFSMISFLELTT